MINTKIKVGNYYADKSKNLPDTFYQQIIELENEIQLSPHPSIDKVRDLGLVLRNDD